MAKLKASEVGKMQKLFEDMEEKENLLKMYRKQFDNQCKVYFGKSAKEIEQILSEKCEVKTKQKTEQKTEQKAEQKSEVKTEQKAEQKSEQKTDDYASEFARMHGLNK